jgi:apolipoprotein D and lipocalin family protein
MTMPRKRNLRSMLTVIGAVALLCALSACSAMQAGPVGNNAVPQPIKGVELDRYLGRWYEYGRYEAGFQKGCEAVTADYSLRDDGKIAVLNSCRKGGVAGKLSTAEGKAKIVDGAQNTKLKVSFFGPFYGDYWVLDRADDYSWAIVGEPSGRYLWMLTRTAKPDDATKVLLETRVKELGYDWALVRFTQH